jgi:hypothetical protein
MLTMFDVRSASEEADDKLRAFIRETVSLAAHHANLAGACADLGDDEGLQYALKCFAASFASASWCSMFSMQRFNCAVIAMDAWCATAS